MLDPKDFVRSLSRGRARLRHASLKGLSPEEVESLTAMIAGFDGITSVKLNPCVGSLLVTWDESKTNAETLLAAAQFFLPDEEAAAEPCEACACAQAVEGAECAPSECAAAEAKSEAKTPKTVRECVKSLAVQPTKLVLDAGSLAKKGADRTLDMLAPVVAPDVKAGGRSRRVTQNRLMLAGYAASIASLAFRSTAAHWVIGSFFTALLGVHLYQHRRVL